MGTKILIYFWMLLSIALVAIPARLVLSWLYKKTAKFIGKKAQLFKENADMKQIKTELEQQKEEFITSNEYGYIANEEVVIVPEIEEAEKEVSGLSLAERSPEELKQEAEEKISDMVKEADKKARQEEKEKKKLDSILLEADLLKNEGKIELYEKKLIEAMTIDELSLRVLKPLADLYFTL